ncbi:MAG: class I SAM-dependent methyltransferase [Halioglobus sp.]|nr:class I SAM-dependent methyltransferase [Halioglobus sp.]
MKTKDSKVSSEFYLDNDAVKAFDTEFRDWEAYCSVLSSLGIPRYTKIKVLDIGGGNGIFMDRLLDFFPNATGVVLDYSQFMLDRNTHNPRKKVMQGSATDIDTLLLGENYDLITINVLLHHLVGEDEEQNLINITRCLKSLHCILAGTGKLVVYEQVYEGWLRQPSPGEIIYRITKVKSGAFSFLMKRLGANTAGVGVRFRSIRGWQGLFERHNFRSIHTGFVLEDKPSIFRKIFLNIRKVGSYLFVLEIQNAGARSENSHHPAYGVDE